MNIFDFITLDDIFEKNSIHEIPHPLLYESFIREHIIDRRRAESHELPPCFRISIVSEIGAKLLERKGEYLKSDIPPSEKSSKLTREKIGIGSREEYIDGRVLRKYGIDRLFPILDKLHLIDVYLSDSFFDPFLQVFGKLFF